MFDDDDIAIATMISNLAAISIKNAEAYEKLQKANLALEYQLPSEDMIIGKNKDVRKIFESIKKLKGTDSTVLILGNQAQERESLHGLSMSRVNGRNIPSLRLIVQYIHKLYLKVNCLGMKRGHLPVLTD